MKYRKLRIAWSAGWGFLVVLLCVLWARSCWNVDILQRTWSATKVVGIYLEPGALGGGVHVGSATNQWSRSTVPTEQYLETIGRLKSPPPSRIWGYSAFKSEALFLPFWFLTLIAATLATAPWLKWRRFSLRTLLITTTLVAVVLGIVVMLSRS